jgi:hypothetical protein
MRADRASSIRRLLWTAAVAALALVAPVAGARAADDSSTPPTPAGVGAISGQVVALATGQIAVQEDGGDGPVAFQVAPNATFTRGGYNAVFEELRPGDRIEMTVDGATGTLLRATVEPAGGIGAPSGEAALLAAIGLIGAGCLLAIRLRSGAVSVPEGRGGTGSWFDRLPSLDAHQAPVALSGGRVRR